MKKKTRFVATDMNSDTRSKGSYYEESAKQIPLGDWGKPDDFKGPAVFLASEASSYVTGELLVVSETHKPYIFSRLLAELMNMSLTTTLVG